MTQRSRAILGLAMSASLVAAVVALLALARAEREWPAFPVYAATLDFGPVFGGELLEQTLQAPPTPLRELRLSAVSPWPATVIVRLGDAADSSDSLLFESETRVPDDGTIRVRIPGTLDTSRRSLRLQVVNPPGSLSPLTLQASRTDPYPIGRAAARDDSGAGNVDLVLQTWRRVTPATVAGEVWHAHPPGAAFIVVTLGLPTGLVVHLLRGRTRRWPLPVVISSILIFLTAVFVTAGIGFGSLAPWMA